MAKLSAASEVVDSDGVDLADLLFCTFGTIAAPGCSHQCLIKCSLSVSSGR